MPRRATPTLAAILTAVSMGACGTSGTAAVTTKRATVTLGFINGATTEFHKCLQKSIEAEAARRGVRVITVNSRQDPGTELSNVEKLIAQHVDALIVQTVSSDTLETDIAKARNAKTPIFLTSVTPVDTSGILGAVVVDLNQVGLLDASWVSNDAVGAPAEAGIVAGAPGAASDLLVKGFRDNLPRNVKVVASRPGMFNRAKARAVAGDMIRQHPDLRYAFVANEDMAFGAQQAFHDAGRNVRIVTVNGTDEGLAAVSDGRFAATVANPASTLGEKAIENTLSLLGREPVLKIDYVPISLIGKEDLGRAPQYC